jgi:hypothetical protein
MNTDYMGPEQTPREPRFWLVLAPPAQQIARMTKYLKIVLPGLLALLLTGCLEFEQQNMTFRHDSATDTLYIFQDYQGVFGVEDPARLSETEKEQMASVMNGERTFFFANWLAEFNRKVCLEMSKTPKGELDSDEAYEAALRPLLDLALANIKVENVGFYLNREGRLCGAQRVTVKNVSKVGAALNHWLPLVLRREGNKWEKLKDARRALHAFADSGQDALRLEGNRLEIHWPASEQEYQDFKEQTPQAAAFRKCGGEISFTNRMIVLAFGKPDAKSVSLTLPMSDRPYSTNALAEARKYGIKESFDAVGSAKAFMGGPASGEKNP